MPNEIINKNDDSQKQKLRRKKLKLILDKYFFSIAALAEKINISRANVSTLLSGNRPFTLYTANKIEAALNLTNGYLSNELVDDSGLTDFISVCFYEDMKYMTGSSFEKKIKIPTEIIKKMKLHTDGSNILVTHMNDDLMNPSIREDEMIFIDCTQNFVEDGMIYLVEINGFYRVRRLFVNNDVISIHIDNLNEKKKYEVKNIYQNQLNVIGKLVGSIKTF